MTRTTAGRSSTRGHTRPRSVARAAERRPSPYVALMDDLIAESLAALRMDLARVELELALVGEEFNPQGYLLDYRFATRID